MVASFARMISVRVTCLDQSFRRKTKTLKNVLYCYGMMKMEGSSTSKQVQYTQGSDSALKSQI